MSKKFSKKPLAAAIGTAVATTLSFAPVVNAEQNPFGMSDLSTGYLELAEGEGSCGANMKKGEGEAKCGDKMKKKAEATCGEGKCGEGKCAGKKKAEKKAEGKCGEGKCGEGKCAGKKKAE